MFRRVHVAPERMKDAFLVITLDPLVFQVVMPHNQDDNREKRARNAERMKPIIGVFFAMV